MLSAYAEKRNGDLGNDSPMGMTIGGRPGREGLHLAGLSRAIGALPAGETADCVVPTG